MYATFGNLKQLFFLVLIFIVLSGLFWFGIQTQNVDYGELLSLNISIQTTVVVTTFTFVLVSIQLASVQFSPRILRSFFAKDKKIALVFTLFILNIVYCLVIKLLGLKTENDKFFPVLGLVYGIGLIGLVLPWFFSYITNAMNVSTITQKITQLVVKNIQKNYKKEIFIPVKKIENESLLHKKEIKSNEMGYLQHIDYKVLNRVAKNYEDDFFQSNQIVGTFIQPNETIVSIFSKKENILSEAEKELLRSAFSIGKYRRIDCDLNYGIRQLVDIAIKAISPAVNDPTTAINCLNYIGVIVQCVGYQAFPSLDSEILLPNVAVKEPDFKHIVDHSFDQIYFWGKNDPVIVLAILNTIKQIINDLDNPEHRQVLLDEIKDMQIDPSIFSPEQKSLIEKALKSIK